jgi:hypothetical protein
MIDELEHSPVPLTGEDLVDRCKKRGQRPHKDNAFGAVVGWLKKHGFIVEAGFTRRRKGHGAPGAVLWALNPNR